MSIKSFQRAFTLVSALLIVICLILIGLNSTRGPRIRRVEFDRRQVVQDMNQRLTMYANQPLSSVRKSQIHVVPQTDFSVTSSGQVIVLQFSRRLRYNTVYNITIQNVSSSRRQATKTDLHYTFRTADPELYYIRRNHGFKPDGLFDQKQPDAIMRTTLSGNHQEVIYMAPKIQDYTLSGSKLIVATINDDKTNSLYLVDTRSKHVESLTLPARGTVSKLRASPNQRLAGFSFSSIDEDYSKRRYESVLFNIDLVAARLTYPIKGLDKKPLQIMDWQFAPDGTTILADAYDTSLLLIDTNGTHDPVPLGQASAISNFSYNGDKISAYSDNGPVLIDALKHTKTSLQYAPIDGLDPYALSVQLLSNNVGYVSRLDVTGFDGTIYQEDFVLHQNGTDRTIDTVDSSQTDVDSFGLAPNDQYMILEQSLARNDTSDNYSENGKTYSTHTVLVDTASGKTVKDIDGFNISWR